MKEINEHIIRIIGKSSIEKPLNLGEGYEVNLKGEITAITRHDNEDNTEDVEYKFVPKIAEIKTELGETIKVKDLRKMSQKIRGVAFKFWEANPKDPRDNEKAYEDFCKIILFRAEDIYEEALKYHNEKKN